MEHGCATEKSDKICRSRGGESCAFDGAMIVLQPIADTAHLVHGPIACCGNSWEGRGTRSHRGTLHRRGFTTDMGELDIVYGAGTKLSAAIREIHRRMKPKAIFVYSTCVSGLIGEDMEAVCKEAGAELGIRVIPVDAAGFVGPKNLGNRIAGEVLLNYVIGTGEPPPPLVFSDGKGLTVDINLIGEYNIAGDLWLVEPVLKRAGFNVLSRMTGDAAFEEITWAHRANLNVVVCSRALINVAKGMEQRYGIPYAEVSFFGKTEMAKALRKMAQTAKAVGGMADLSEQVERVIATEESALSAKIESYEHLRGKKAVLYTGGVKSWSFISALMDLGIEIVAVGTKKSTFEDEEKMREIMGEEAPLVEDVTPKNLKRLLTERGAHILVAGGRNQYLAIKEGYPFVDVNQERHVAYAGYDGLVNLAEQISNSIRFYERADGGGRPQAGAGKGVPVKAESTRNVLIDPLKHSASIGAAMAFQGIHNALPVLHGAQGCTFLAKVLLTKHFREPVALGSTKIFVEDAVMGSEERLEATVREFKDKNGPDVIGVLTSGLTEVKGDDVPAVVRRLTVKSRSDGAETRIIHVPTPDYEGGLEEGYARAVEALVRTVVGNKTTGHPGRSPGKVNIMAGSHLTPADFLELRETAEAFGLRPVMLPDLSCLDGSREGISPLASGGTDIEEVESMGSAGFTLVLGGSLEPAARVLNERFGIGYRVFHSLSGLEDTDRFMETLSMLGGKPVPARYGRQRRILVDGMRDAHIHFGRKRVCIALDPDHALQTSHWLAEMAADIPLAVVPVSSAAAGLIRADRVMVGDLFSIEGEFDLLISNSHAEDTAARLGTPLLQAGFPVYRIFGHANGITTGYHGTLCLIQDAANILAKEAH